MPTREEWRVRILDELAEDGVDVELTERQLDAAIQRALELWAERKPYTKWFPFEIPAAETVVITFFSDPELTDGKRYPDTSIRNILDVRTQSAERRDTLGVGSTTLVSSHYLRWGGQGPRLSFELQVAERTYERLTGSRPDWWWEPDERKLYITTPSRSVRIMVLASRPRYVEEIAYYDERKFLQAATARAKLILARVLGSMGDIPGPAGPIQTDHDRLNNEGKEEWREIREQLEVSLATVPPPTWVG